MEKRMGILDRIHASYYQLTATERRVADYVLSQYAQVQFMSITQLADECGTAEASISRFCRSLGLKGFNAFKIELARHSALVNGEQHPEAETDTPAGRRMEVGRLAKEAVNQTIELSREKDLLRAVKLFEKAGRVISIGSGGSMILAQAFAQIFSPVNSKFSAVIDSHMQMSAVATMGPEDVVVLFSYSGATTVGVQVLEQAKNRGVHTVLVTRFSKSPAAKLADVVLCCGSSEGPFQAGSVPAKVAQLVVMDMLFQEYCHRNYESCQENIQSIAAALSGMHL